jgi:hypothetical protein
MIKKILICLLLIGLMISTTGCIIYGKGKISGYVTTTENGIFWDKVYIKSSLESSKEDCFLINKNNIIYDELSGYSTTRLNFNYNRHFMTLSDECYNDEIISYTKG